MKIIETKIPGVLIIEPKVFGDNRGCFLETYQQQRYQESGLALSFVQDNFSRSAKGVLRGLHHQTKHTQGKLIWVTLGNVFDVAVDIRRGSPSFGQWLGFDLDDQTMRQVYLPPGIAHGFQVVSEQAHFHYKCTDYYDPSAELSIAWNDPSIGIDWPVANPELSDKDREGKALADINPDLLPSY